MLYNEIVCHWDLLVQLVERLLRSTMLEVINALDNSNALEGLSEQWPQDEKIPKILATSGGIPRGIPRGTIESL
jgi:hypothetical protein